jgi:hypothetical protein
VSATGTRSRLASPATASVLGALVLVAVVASVPLGQLGDAPSWYRAALAGAVTLAFAGVGVAVARRQPRNAVGWMLIAVGALTQLCIYDASLSLVAVYEHGHDGVRPLGWLAIVLSQCWPAALLLPPLAILLFPDGRVPSPRWRWAVWAYLAASGLLIADQVTTGVSAIVERRIRIASGGYLTSPAPRLLASAAVSAAGALLVATVGVCWVAFVARQVSSYRRATGERRQQLKWVMWGAAITAASIPGFLLGSSSSPILSTVGGVIVFGIAALPITIGVGILKYRLYEIDVIVRKTLVYTALVAVLAVVYFGGVYLFDRALQVVTGQSGALAVTLSTLAVAAAFQPLRRRIQRAVDRRFYRHRYDAARTLASFTGRLRDEIDVAALEAEILGVARATLQPRHASLWLRPGGAGAPSDQGPGREQP